MTHGELVEVLERMQEGTLTAEHVERVVAEVRRLQWIISQLGSEHLLDTEHLFDTEPQPCSE